MPGLHDLDGHGFVIDTLLTDGVARTSDVTVDEDGIGEHDEGPSGDGEVVTSSDDCDDCTAHGTAFPQNADALHRCLMSGPS
jgi:hypothetical protein